MNKTLILAALLAASASIAQAQTYGTPAYPDNWQGGPPLPPVNQPMGYVAQPQGYYLQPRVQYVEPREYYAQPSYAQPQVRYVQPQVRYVPAQTYASRAYGTTYASRAYGTTYASRAYGTTYASRASGTTYGYQQPRVPLVQGPPQSRCVVANLNGTARQDGCGMVQVSPADFPMLRQKFSAYRPNSGYVLNLPADSDYR